MVLIEVVLQEYVINICPILIRDNYLGNVTSQLLCFIKVILTKEYYKETNVLSERSIYVRLKFGPCETRTRSDDM